MSTRVFAPAKINLTLQVGAPRADGMHPLHSLVVFADVGDWVEAYPADEIALREIVGPFAPDLDRENNLVSRAARALADVLGVAQGAALRLEKNLPVASGIGGGSSDAAAALKACRALWRLANTDATLVGVAAGLGADVPVCVAARSAWMTGIGENVTPISLPALHAVLVNPLKALPTPAVFHAFDSMGLGAKPCTSSPPSLRNDNELLSFVMQAGNDLERPAVALMPVVGDILRTLRGDARVQCAGVSGSGATCFALLASSAMAEALASDLRTRRRDWWVRATRLNAA